MGYYNEPTHDEGVRMGENPDICAAEAAEIALREKLGKLGERQVTKTPRPELTVPKMAVSKYKTMVAAYVFGELVPEWEKLFEAKNAGYGEYDSELGPLGEVVELHRKLGKLKRAFIHKVDTSDWDEGPREVAMDMIGHLFLLVYVLDEESDAPEG